MESTFNNKLDSKYTKDNKMVLPFLPHVYLNIVDELYKENLYKIDINNTHKQEQEEENEENINGNNDNEIIKDFIINNNNNNKDNEELNIIKGTVNKFYHYYCFSSKLSSEYIEVDQQIMDAIIMIKFIHTSFY